MLDVTRLAREGMLSNLLYVIILTLINEIFNGFRKVPKMKGFCERGFEILPMG